MSITIQDIAKELNISKSTVSKALNNRKGVSKSLRLKVQELAERYGYRPYISTRETGMYKKESNMIGIVYPEQANAHIIKELQTGIDSVLRTTEFLELRFSVNVFEEIDTPEKKELYLRRIISSGNLDGIIFAFIEINNKNIHFLHNYSVPSVILNHYCDMGKCVFIDNEKAAFDVTEKLIKLDKQNIGIILPESYLSQVWSDRLKGYIKALRKNKIKYTPSLIVYENTFVFKNVSEATKKLVHTNPKLDAVIYSGDLQAYAGIKTIKDMNLKIPEDIAVIGFDDMYFNDIVEPSLSSVQQPLYEMGKTGTQMLLKSIRKNDFSPEHKTLYAKLKLRKSCNKNYRDIKWGRL